VKYAMSMIKKKNHPHCGKSENYVKAIVLGHVSLGDVNDVGP